MTEGQGSLGHPSRSLSSTVLALGLALCVLGAAWWAFDADPGRGQVLLVAGVVVAVAGRGLVHRLGPRGQRLLVVIAVLVALLLLIDAVHLAQVALDQRGSHPA